MSETAKKAVSVHTIAEGLLYYFTGRASVAEHQSIFEFAVPYAAAIVRQPIDGSGSAYFKAHYDTLASWFEQHRATIRQKRRERQREKQLRRQECKAAFLAKQSKKK